MPATSLNANELGPSPTAYVALVPLAYVILPEETPVDSSSLHLSFSPDCRETSATRKTNIFELHGSSVLPVILSCCICIKGNKRNPSQSYFSSVNGNKIYEEKKKGGGVTLILVMHEETRGRLGKAFIYPSPTHSFITHSSKFSNY